MKRKKERREEGKKGAAHHRMLAKTQEGPAEGTLAKAWLLRLPHPALAADSQLATGGQFLVHHVQHIRLGFQGMGLTRNRHKVCRHIDDPVCVYWRRGGPHYPLFSPPLPVGEDGPALLGRGRLLLLLLLLDRAIGVTPVALSVTKRDGIRTWRGCLARLVWPGTAAAACHLACRATKLHFLPTGALTAEALPSHSLL